eukprot:Opistho-2@36480
MDLEASSRFTSADQIDPYEGKTYEERASLRALRRKLRSEGDAPSSSLPRSPSGRALSASASAVQLRSTPSAHPVASRGLSLPERALSLDRLKFFEGESVASGSAQSQRLGAIGIESPAVSLGKQGESSESSERGIAVGSAEVSPIKAADKSRESVTASPTRVADIVTAPAVTPVDIHQSIPVDIQQSTTQSIKQEQVAPESESLDGGSPVVVKEDRDLPGKSVDRASSRSAAEGKPLFSDASDLAGDSVEEDRVLAEGPSCEQKIEEQQDLPEITEFVTSSARDELTSAEFNSACTQGVSVQEEEEAEGVSASSREERIAGLRRLSFKQSRGQAGHFESGSTLHTSQDLQQLVEEHPVLLELSHGSSHSIGVTDSDISKSNDSNNCNSNDNNDRESSLNLGADGQAHSAHGTRLTLQAEGASESQVPSRSDSTDERVSRVDSSVNGQTDKGSVFSSPSLAAETVEKGVEEEREKKEERESALIPQEPSGSAGIEVRRRPSVAGMEAVEDAVMGMATLERKASIEGKASMARSASNERLRRRRSTSMDYSCTPIKDEEPPSFTPDLSSLIRAITAKAQTQAFELNLMVAGETGLGKTTFIDTFFNITRDRAGVPFGSSPSTVDIVTRTHTIEDANARISLTIIDTPGYGDKVNNAEQAIQPILNYLDQQHNDYMNGQFAQLFGDGSKALPRDSRVHCCLLFIAPTGHGLKSHDLIMLRKLCPRVNVIPIIAKADTLTRAELDAFRVELNKEFDREGLTVYNFTGGEENVYSRSGNGTTDPLPNVPLAVVSSTDKYELPNGRVVPGRKYKWGVVEVFNENHSDFAKLRRLLLGQHFQRLKDITHEVHYEAYRQVHRNRLALHFENKIKAKLKQRISAMRDDVSTNLAASASLTSMSALPSSLAPTQEVHSRTSSESLNAATQESPHLMPQQKQHQRSPSRETSPAPTPTKPAGSPSVERRSVHFSVADDRRKSPEVGRRGMAESVRAAYEEGGDGSAIAAAIAAAHAGQDPASAAAAAAATLAEDFRGRTDTSTRAELAKAMLQQKYQTIGAMTKTGHQYNPLADRRKAMMDRRSLANVGFAPAGAPAAGSPPTVPRGDLSPSTPRADVSSSDEGGAGGGGGGGERIVVVERGGGPPGGPGVNGASSLV